MVKKEKNSLKDFKLMDLEGIGEKTAMKLAEIGVKNPIDFIIRGKELTAYMDADVLNRSLERVYRQMTEAGVLPRTDSVKALWEYRQKKIYFNTGSDKINTMLGGGIESQTVTEVYGQEGAGKTQFCLTTMVEAIRNKINVYFVDCEGTLDLDRVKIIAESRGITVDDEFWSYLHYDLALDTYNIIRISNDFVSKVIDNDIKLIIIDGALGQFRLEYSQGRGDLKTRQDDIKPFLNHAKQLSFWLNLGIVITNQVIGNSSGFGDPILPVGGYVVSHLPQRIIMFVKGSKNKRIIKLKKSAKSENYEEDFYLTEGGISDTDKWKVPKKNEFDEKGLKDTSLLDK